MTTSRVLTVGIDGSPNSSRALAWAAREARRRGCLLRAVQAYSLPVYGGEFGGSMAAYQVVDMEELKGFHTTAAAEQLAEVTGSGADLETETIVESGWAVGAIVDHSADAELVVVGSRGAGAVAAMFLGSIAHGVAHRSQRPVVLVPDTAISESITRIVVGTDGSEASNAAIDWAADEAELWGAELTLAHAWEYPYLGIRTGTAEPAELMELDAANVLAESVEALRSRRPNLSITVHAHLVSGPAASALADFAAERDLLVLGARGRGAFRSAVLGSTSSAAIHHCHVPLAVIHPS